MEARTLAALAAVVAEARMQSETTVAPISEATEATASRVTSQGPTHTLLAVAAEVATATPREPADWAAVAMEANEEMHHRLLGFMDLAAVVAAQVVLLPEGWAPAGDPESS